MNIIWNNINNQKSLFSLPNESKEEELKVFYKSDTFQGSKKGYVFKTGDYGTGYYKD